MAKRMTYSERHKHLIGIGAKHLLRAPPSRTSPKKAKESAPSQKAI
ncbi:MAG: hypothetical protein GY822_07440 [Deltaproteobacteria bacterium]|nr:hypothetical protein [Deltaproteobacteria bacterium]